MKKVLFVSILMLGSLWMPTLQTPVMAEAVSVRQEQSDRKYYRRLLIQFCENYYSQMFPNQTFMSSPFVVREVIEEGYGVVRVIGKHSFRAANGRRYNSRDFSALIISEQGRIIRIDFRKENPADLTHVKDYWVEGSIKLGLSSAEQTQRNEARLRKQFLTMIENYSVRNYSSCFSGRTYVRESIQITKLSRKEDGNIIVYGTHSYRGRMGSLYSNAEFEVTIRVIDDEDGYEPSYQIVKFRKQSQPDLMNSSVYWEECNRKG